MRLAMTAADAVAGKGPRLLLAGFGLVGAAFVWGSAIPFTSELLHSFDTFLLPALRFLIAAPALAMLVVIVEGRWAYGGPVPWRKVLLLGFSMAAFATCYTIGIMLSDPITAAIIFTGGPIVASLLAKAMYRTPFEPGLGIAILLAVAGGVLLIWGVPRATGPGLGLRGGEALIVSAMFCWSWYSLKAQEWLGRRGFSQLRLSALTCTACGGWLLAAYGAAAWFGWSLPPVRAPGLGDFGMLLWISLLGAGLAVVMWNFGNSRVGIPVASLYGNLAPVFAVLVASLFGAPMTALQILGGMLVLFGVLQVQVRRLRVARPAGGSTPGTQKIE